MKRKFSKALSLTALLVIVILAVSFLFLKYLVAADAHDLMEGIQTKTPLILPSEQSEALRAPIADFSVKLLQNTFKEGENTLISPFSVSLALGMTGNGAAGETRAEFEKVLCGGKSIDDLNSFYYEMTKRLTGLKSEKLSIANSIWYRNSQNLRINLDFLQKNADYYGAAAYKEDFDNPAAKKKMNKWVSNKTKGTIKDIVDQIDPETVMFLINTLYFDGKWETVYKKSSVNDNTFQGTAGEVTVPFMYSVETKYFEDNGTAGFIKPYKGGNISFAAILPKAGVSVEEYLSTLTGEKLQTLLENAKEVAVRVGLPKFESEFDISLNNALKNMGLIKGFDDESADFTDMSQDGDLYISNVRHKTYIKVAEKGTVAGAATSIMIKKNGGMGYEQEIILNRPFIYMIIDNKTNLPLFLGVMQNPKA